jgi:hypothetical protein
MNYKLKLGEQCYFIRFPEQRWGMQAIDYQTDIDNKWGTLNDLDTTPYYNKIIKKKTLVSKLSRVLFYDS